MVNEKWHFKNSTNPLILEDLPTVSGGKWWVIIRIFFLKLFSFNTNQVFYSIIKVIEGF